MSDLLGYLLNLDEPPERRRAEERLRDDPRAAAELRALHIAVSPLEADREPPAPPDDLVARTLAHVAEHAGPTAEPIDVLVSRMQPRTRRHLLAAPDRPEGAGSRWRRADLLVAAATFALGLGVLFAALPFVRQRHEMAACQNHMRTLFQAFDTYADTHAGRFPQVSEQPPYQFASSFVDQLREAGALTTDEGLRCPAAGSHAGYAYTLGYRDGAGELQGLRLDEAGPNRDLIPVTADRPALGRRSPNPDHLSGQNVLFAGGNVRFCASSGVGVGGDDIYRNKRGKVGAGVSIFDSVLGVGGDRP